MTVGERIKHRRKELGISADDLAAAVGVSRSTMFRYEKGDIEKVPGDTLVPIANALHTTPQYLMGWVHDPDESAALLASLAEDAKRGCLEAEDAMYKTFGADRDKLALRLVGGKTAVLFYKAYKTADTAGLVMEILENIRDLDPDELLVISGMLRGFVDRKNLQDE